MTLTSRVNPNFKGEISEIQAFLLCFNCFRSSYSFYLWCFKKNYNFPKQEMWTIVNFAEIRLFKKRVCSFVCHLCAGVHRGSLEAGATVAGSSRRAISAFPAHKCLVFYQIYKIQKGLI